MGQWITVFSKCFVERVFLAHRRVSTRDVSSVGDTLAAPKHKGVGVLRDSAAHNHLITSTKQASYSVSGPRGEQLNDMPGAKKRSSEGTAAARSTKVARTSTNDNKSKNTKKKSKAKAALGASEFKARALPLHVNITHTPPAIPGEEPEGIADAASTDPGFIGTTTLLPSIFSTGSYGWKGNKRITIEIEDSESEEKEKVHVMLTINATVIGSKNAANEENEEENGDQNVEGEQ